VRGSADDGHLHFWNHRAGSQRGLTEHTSCLLLQAVTLRRLKSSTFDGRPIIQLPQRIVNVNLAPFATREEREFYESVEKQTQVHLRCMRIAQTPQPHGNSEHSDQLLRRTRV
jgi:hypothetical protein